MFETELLGLVVEVLELAAETSKLLKRQKLQKKATACMLEAPVLSLRKSCRRVSAPVGCKS